MFEVKIH